MFSKFPARCMRVLFVAIVLVVCSGVSRADSLQVAVSIKPVHGLVTALMYGVAEPALLLDGSGDAHSLSLRPSKARLLEGADIVIIVGPTLEHALARSIESIATDAVRIDLLDLKELTLYESRSAGKFATIGTVKNDKAHAVDASHTHDHEHDPHVFLSPEQVRAIVNGLSRRLIEINPHNAQLYRSNRDTLLARINAVDDELKKLLDPVRDAPYLVYHDAYQGFEKHFDLNPLGAVAVSPGRSPGARRVRELVALVKESNAVCVFSEPQFPPKLVNQLVEATGIRRGSLDPIGSSLQAGPDHWFEMVRKLADDLVACLKG